MEFINNVELAGVVGQVRKTDISNGFQGVSFAISVNLIFQADDGAPVMEATWIPCTMFLRKNKPCENQPPENGDRVRIRGRLKATRYTGGDGRDNTVLKVIVKNIEKIEDEEDTDTTFR